MTAMPVLLKLNCLSQLSRRSWRFVLGYGMTAAGVAIANNAFISLVARVFPVPFTQFAPTLPMAAVGGILNRFFLQKPEIKARAEKIDQWLAMDMVPILVYPIFTAVFMALKPSQQLWLSLLLPVIKRLLGLVIWLVLQGDLDLVGPTTCSVGYLYHVLFTAMCLQNAKSLETLGAVVLVNTLQMVLNCRDIVKDAASIQRTKPQHSDSSISAKDDVVATTLPFAQQEHVSKSLHRKLPSRMFLKYPGYQTIDFMTRHQLLLQQNDPSSTPSVTPLVVNDCSRPRSLLSAASLSKQTTSPTDQELTQIFPLGPAVRESGRSLLKMSRAKTVPAMQSRGSYVEQSEIYVRDVTSALH
ncbi:hypothetical protein JG687_00014917 [Phytophthora cactorum]|uniref:Uncharacterized protein n=1 Tax=Phytophthora cactorum TaxID=29920 RepID=A0A8T1U097_9STRA|nr:hypothetical protein JG687_00014917 [Phytophthora cactorum]